MSKWLNAMVVPMSPKFTDYYGNQSGQKESVGEGYCAVSGIVGGSDVGLIQSRNKNAEVRFASLKMTLGSFELVSTGFEKFPDHNFGFDHPNLFIFPSDTVLGMTQGQRNWRFHVFYHNLNEYNNQPWVDCTWEYEMIAHIDSLYAQLIGANVENTWTIQSGYQAVRQDNQDHVIRISVTLTDSSQMVIKGFTGNSVTVNLQRIPGSPAGSGFQIEVSDVLKFDSLSKWTKPNPPSKRGFFDIARTHHFVRSGYVGLNSLYTVRMRTWPENWFHQVTISHEILGLEDPERIIKFVGSPQKLRTYTYRYWFGRITNFPNTLPGNFSTWYYFSSLFNADVSIPIGEDGKETKKLKNSGSTKFIELAEGVWNNLVGVECKYPDGIIGYISTDFQVITFDGRVKSVTLVFKRDESNFYIEECDILPDRDTNKIIPSVVETYSGELKK
jgi:hypothetical protein